MGNKDKEIERAKAGSVGYREIEVDPQKRVDRARKELSEGEDSSSLPSPHELRKAGLPDLADAVAQSRIKPPKE